RQAEEVDHLGAVPPFAGRKIHRARAEGEEHECEDDQLFHQSFFPSSTHVSHCTTLWKSLSSSLCHGSCGTLCCCCSSMTTGCAGAGTVLCAVVVTGPLCCGSMVR